MDIKSKKIYKQCICFVLPTFNEEANIRQCIESVFSLQESNQNLIKVLVVDDNSSDKTQKIVRDLKDQFSELHMITGEKKGLGDAYKRGFKYSLDQLDPEVIFQMDADGQHDPSLAPKFLELLQEGNDFVIGSRFIDGGATPDFSIRRKFISKIGNILVRYAGGVRQIKDCTSGYRAIRATYLRDCDLGFLSTRGYSFQSSLLCELIWRGAKTVETPIKFISRKGGDSKLSFRDQMEFILNIPKLGFRNAEDFIKYSVVGFSGVLVNIGIYIVLTRFFGLSEVIAPLISIESSLLSNFFLNNFWTFKKRKVTSSLYKRLLQFHVASGGAACFNYLTFLLTFAVLGIHDILANLIGIAVAAILNYLINSNWTWRKGHGSN
tara:strand:- start:3177 stop:4313 length:1137 start_codon:yes stop_codon:yes gene_type:complete